MTVRRWPWLALQCLLASCKPSPLATPTPTPLTTPTPTKIPIAARRARAELDTSCLKDADCVPAPGCCPAPCTSHVINVKELPRAQKELESCPKGEPCPSAGGCVTHAYLCVAGKCALVMEGEPAYHVR
jgi:hypothetical protein